MKIAAVALLAAGVALVGIAAFMVIGGETFAWFFLLPAVLLIALGATISYGITRSER